MDHLRCKTPERVRNEFYTHLLGYNLLRGVMARAAFEADRSPGEISFKGTLQTLQQFLPILLTSVSSERRRLSKRRGSSPTSSSTAGRPHFAVTSSPGVEPVSRE